jgi:UDP-2-acetamido-3-amino-2,3-dideoxy-glucuronate N-acetyltransferase
VQPSAEVHPTAVLGDGTAVWELAQVRENAVLGRDCIVGRGAYVDAAVVLGDRCKVQNHALLYAPARLGNGVFVGPGAVLTNDAHPRAVTPEGDLKSGHDWQPVGVVVEDGASLGARCVVLGGVTVGAWAMVGAGAVVTRDVVRHALVLGVPARWSGWVGREGVPLIEMTDGVWVCPSTGLRYEVVHDVLTEVSGERP